MARSSRRGQAAGSKGGRRGGAAAMVMGSGDAGPPMLPPFDSGSARPPAPRRRPGAGDAPARSGGGGASMITFGSGDAGPPMLPQADPGVFGPQVVFPNRALRGLGWLRDVPDFRDSTIQKLTPKFSMNDRKKSTLYEKERDLFDKATGPLKAALAANAPPAVDNRAWCSPVEDQGNLGSCTANACVGMVEYMERRSGSQHVDGSRLFVYKTTRKLLGWTGDTGAFLRSTMQALVLFGVPPEETWRYEIESFDNEPDPYMYSYAANYKATQYFRIDPPDAKPADTLDSLKTTLSKNYVVMFGFSVYSSLNHSADIPTPGRNDTLRGGHAVLAVGYDDNRPVFTADERGQPQNSGQRGALLIRNSWGTGWGDAGYGWLPYAYIEKGLAADFWTCTKQEWVDSKAFQ